MRNPDRLDLFYEEVKQIHKERFPDWRFGQLCSNFISWMFTEKKCDIFFPEEEKLLKYLKEFADYE